MNCDVEMLAALQYQCEVEILCFYCVSVTVWRKCSEKLTICRFYIKFCAVLCGVN